MMEIYKKMAAILAEIDSVSKDRKSVGSFSFAYRGIDDVMNALHQAFGKHGVFITQTVIDHKMDQIDKRFHHRVLVEFTFNASDGSNVKSTVWGECIENGDKGIGKCMSYALKTCLLETFLIPTEDESKDPDSRSQPAFQNAPQVPKNAPQRRVPQKDLTMDNMKTDMIEFIESIGPVWEQKAGKPASHYVIQVKNCTDMQKLKTMQIALKSMVDKWEKEAVKTKTQS